MNQGINIQQRLLDRLTGAPAVIVGAYVLISVYLTRKGLAGRIAGARAWSEKTWLRACGITRKNVHDLVTSSCAFWNENDLVLCEFCHEKVTAASPSYSLSKKEGEDKEEAGGSAQARETPPPPPPVPSSLSRTSSKKASIRDILIRNGIPCNSLGEREWAGGLNRVVRAKSDQEADAFVRWAVVECEGEGITVRHWRDVAALGAEWNRRRAELYQCSA